MTPVRSALSLAALVAGALVSTACNDPLPSVPQRTYAYAVLAAQPVSGGDSYQLRSSAFFFRTNSLNPLNSAHLADRCVNQAYVPPVGAVDTLPAVNYLDAGAALSLATAGGTTASLLAQTDAFGKKFYAPDGNGPIAPFTPGELVTISVPGGSGANSFPQTELSIATVTPFTFTDVATSSNDPSKGLKLTWTPPPPPPTGSDSTGMFVSLRYALVGTGPANRELLCSLQDDGEYVIDQDVAASWFTSLPNGHQVVFTRWRGELSDLQAGNFYKQIISTLAVTQATTTTTTATSTSAR